MYDRILREVKGSYFLFGARGTGKSTWLKQQYKNVKYINLLDESLYQEYLTCPQLFADELRMLPEGSWIVIDEIQ